MPHKFLAPVNFITRQDELCHLVDSLLDEPLVAVDTESNSLHAYRERVCLVQLSTRTADYILDPLALPDMQPLGVLMAATHIEKVFHAAEYDVMCMKRDFGFEFDTIFDTMLAARICGLPAVGLGSLIKAYEGIDLDKSHQRDDWGQRPLPEESLHYAQMDTHYLPLLRDVLFRELEMRGRLDEAMESFAELHNIPAASGRAFDEDGFWNLGRPYLLKKQEMAVLREVYLLRERIAQQTDVPPYKVIENKALVNIARAMPSTLGDLRDVHGIGRKQVSHYGKRILRAVQRGLSQKDQLPPQPYHPIPDPVITERYTLLHAWRKARALQRGVESDIIVSKHVLWDVARSVPATLDELRDVSGMGPWRMDAYGEEILDVLETGKVPEMMLEE